MYCSGDFLCCKAGLSINRYSIRVGKIEMDAGILWLGASAFQVVADDRFELIVLVRENGILSFLFDIKLQKDEPM